MTFSELFAEVVTVTNRPELLDDIKVGLRRSTLKMHGLEFWKFDLQQKYVSISPQSYNFQISIADNFPNWRQWCFIKGFNPTGYDSLLNTYTGSWLQDFNPADANRLINSYGKQFSDVYYTAGKDCNFRSSIPLQMILVGYYSRPVITPEIQYDSWIAREYPYAIIDDACKGIFKAIGMDDKVKLFDQMVAEHIQVLKTNYLEDQSR